MKLRWKIAFAFVALATIPALLLSLAPNQAERELEATRRSLRQQGFKIDLKEFDFSLSPEQSARRNAWDHHPGRAHQPSGPRPGLP